MRRQHRNFVDNGYAAEIVLLEKQFGRDVVGDDQLSLTRFQKQVLSLEYQRQQEDARNQHGSSQSPAGPINARNPSVGGSTRRETVRYKNNRDNKSDNQAEFVDGE